MNVLFGGYGPINRTTIVAVECDEVLLVMMTAAVAVTTTDNNNVEDEDDNLTVLQYTHTIS